MTVSLRAFAQRKFRGLTHHMQTRLAAAISLIEQDPRPAGAIKLRDREACRLPVGDYRVMDEIDNGQQSVVVLDVGHRLEIYR